MNHELSDTFYIKGSEPKTIFNIIKEAIYKTSKEEIIDDDNDNDDVVDVDNNDNNTTNEVNIDAFYNTINFYSFDYKNEINDNSSSDEYDGDDLKGQNYKFTNTINERYFSVIKKIS